MKIFLSTTFLLSFYCAFGWGSCEKSFYKDVNFAGVRSKDQNFIGQNFQGKDFKRSELISAQFRGADLRGTDWQDSRSPDMDWRGADARGSVLIGMDLTKIKLHGVDVRGAIVTKEQAEYLKSQGFSGFFVESAEIRAQRLLLSKEISALEDKIKKRHELAPGEYRRIQDEIESLRDKKWRLNSS